MRSTVHDSPQQGAVQESELASLRRRVDAVDQQLLVLLSSRGELVRRLGSLKHAAGMPLCDPSRESDLIAALGACNPGPYTNEELVSMLREVLAASRSLMARDGHGSEPIPRVVHE